MNNIQEIYEDINANKKDNSQKEEIKDFNLESQDNSVKEEYVGEEKRREEKRREEKRREEKRKEDKNCEREGALNNSKELKNDLDKGENSSKTTRNYPEQKEKKIEKFKKLFEKRTGNEKKELNKSIKYDLKKYNTINENLFLNDEKNKTLIDHKEFIQMIEEKEKLRKENEKKEKEKNELLKKKKRRT